jgi:hypothetical protein
MVAQLLYLVTCSRRQDTRARCLESKSTDSLADRESVLRGRILRRLQARRCFGCARKLFGGDESVGKVSVGRCSVVTCLRRTLKRPKEPQWAQTRMAGCLILSGSRAERGNERLANFCCEREWTDNHAGYSRHLEFSLRAHLSLSAPSFLGRQFHWSRSVCKLRRVPSTAHRHWQAPVCDAWE